MPKPRIRALDAAAMRAHSAEARRLERAITYPIDDGRDRFSIDHGADCTAFFAGLGAPRFIAATLDGALVGGVAYAGRVVVAPGGRRLRVAYTGDLKIAPALRGTGLGRRLLARGVLDGLRQGRPFDWDLAFGAAMRGARGDVTRSVKGVTHVGRLLRPLARLHIYFTAPAALAALPDGGPGPIAGGLDLSVDRPRAPVERTTGRKDFRLESTGARWKLAHVDTAPSRWAPTLGATLRAAAPAIEPDEQACFALDTRLDGPVGWLAAHGVDPGAVCTLYGFTHPLRWPRGLPARPWTHLATSEI